MATKTTNKIELMVKQAEDLLTLYDNIEAADSHFKRCQSDLFRNFTMDTVKAQNTESAFAALRQQITAARATEAK